MVDTKPTRVLVLGATGMLGNAVYRLFSASDGFETFATARSANLLPRFAEARRSNIVIGVDVENTDVMAKVFAEHRPDVVINCVGVVKQLSNAKDPLVSIAINSMLPHRLSALCALSGARFVHVSTDCVFNGQKGGYHETDAPDATDLYGRTKLLGEVDAPHAITLRTSIVGRELAGNHSLIDWFLSQKAPIKGFRRAIFSGLPTCELARVIRDLVIPAPQLHGLYHVSSDPIDKYTLLCLVAMRYGSSTRIDPDDDFAIDRSLNSDHFKSATGYRPPAWPELVASMHRFG
jgi:dTDP-4-dehydrorhamnose reductase